MDKYSTLAELKKLAAQIGKMELERKQGIYIPMRDVIAKKKEFKKLAREYRKLKCT